MCRISNIVLVVAFLGLCVSVMAQTEEDQVKAVLTALSDALGRGDHDAVGKLLSGTGFVGLIGLPGETVLLDKEKMLAFLANSAVPVEFQDVKVTTHWMVALVNAKAMPVVEPVQGPLVFDAVLVREAGQWKLAAVCVCADLEQADDEQVKAFVERVAALPNSLKESSSEELSKAVHDEHFLLALVDPSLEFRWTTSKTSLIQMVDSVIPLITVNESRLEVANTVLSPAIAIVDGTWLLDIADFGETKTALRVYAVKVGTDWKIVAVAGGPPRQ